MYKLLSIKKSTNKKYKLQVELYNTETKRIKRIQFGANGMMDFTLYNKEHGEQIANKHFEFGEIVEKTIKPIKHENIKRKNV